MSDYTDEFFRNDVEAELSGVILESWYGVTSVNGETGDVIVASTEDIDNLNTRCDSIEEDVAQAQQDIIDLQNKNNNHVFTTEAEMRAWVEEHKAELREGDSLLCITSDSSDYWWDGTQIRVYKAEKIDLSNYVSFDDKATNFDYGVVKLGTTLNTDADGVTNVNIANSENIALGQIDTKFITPKLQHEAVFYGLAKLAGDEDPAEKPDVPPNEDGEEEYIEDVSLQYTKNAKDVIKSFLSINSFDVEYVQFDEERGTPIVYDWDPETGEEFEIDPRENVLYIVDQLDPDKMPEDIETHRYDKWMVILGRWEKIDDIYKLDSIAPRGWGSLVMNKTKPLNESIELYDLEEDGDEPIPEPIVEEEVIGDYAVILGYEGDATERCSFVEGEKSVSHTPYQHVMGKFNEVTDAAFVIGNGEDEDNRRNIFEIDWEGHIKSGDFDFTATLQEINDFYMRVANEEGEEINILTEEDIGKVNYTLEEAAAGLWTDGSALFRCTFEFDENIVLSAGEWTELPIELNCNKIVDFTCYNDNTVWNLNGCRLNANKIEILNAMAIECEINSLTLVYTKNNITEPEEEIPEGSDEENNEEEGE